MRRQQQHTSGDATDYSSRDPSRRRAIALLAGLICFTLACVTNTISLQVTHNWEPGDEQLVYLELAQELDSAYASGAREANQDIRAQCQAKSIDCTEEMILPETLEQLQANPLFESFDLGDMSSEDFTRTEWQNGIRHRRSWTLAEFQQFLQTPDGADTFLIEAKTDPKSGDTRYVIQLTFPGLVDEGETDDWDWAEWDSMMKEPELPKPELSPPGQDGGEVEVDGGPAMALTGLDQLLGGMLSAVPAGSGGELTAWHYIHILRQMGFPVFLRFVLDPPGNVVNSSFNGQPAGQVTQEGEVVFPINESFLRQYGFAGPWVFRAESVVSAGSTEAKPSDIGNLGTKSDAPKFRRFRIRPLVNKTFGVIVGAVSATYELQELNERFEPGRKVQIRFLGFGPAVSAKWIPPSAYSSGGYQWTEFTVNKEAMALEDFDGIWGWHTDAGAVAKSWTGAVFCTKDSPFKQQARLQGIGTQIGPYAGADLAIGTWRIVSEAQ